MPIPKLLFAYGQEDQAHTAHRHPQPDRDRVLQQKDLSAGQEKREGTIFDAQPSRQEVLLQKH